MTPPLRTRINLDLRDGQLDVAPQVTPGRAVTAALEAGLDVCIVDLDASQGTGRNTDVIESLVRAFPSKLWLGGGFDTESAARCVTDSEIAGVVVGSALFTREGTLQSGAHALADYAADGRVAAAIDHIGQRAVSRAFTQVEHSTAFERIDQLAAAWGDEGWTLLLANVEASLRRSEADWGLAVAVASSRPGLRVYYAGGIDGESRVQALRATGLGVVIGRWFAERLIDDGARYTCP